MWRCISGHFRASCYIISRLSLSRVSIPPGWFSQSWSCLQALLAQKQGQSTTCTCKERNALLPRRGALVSEPWETGDVTTQPDRVSNSNWEQKSRKPDQQLTQKCFSICKAVLNPQETLRINFVLSFLFAQYRMGRGEVPGAFKNAVTVLNPSCASAHWRQLLSHGLPWINNPGSVWCYFWTRF